MCWGEEDFKTDGASEGSAASYSCFLEIRAKGMLISVRSPRQNGLKQNACFDLVIRCFSGGCN